VTRGWLLRAKALLFSLLLLSGGGGMPLLDVALFHRYSTPSRLHNSLEASGVARPHGELCRLGWTVPHSPQGVRVGVEIQVADLSVRPHPAPPADAPRCSDLRLPARPRAPPVV